MHIACPLRYTYRHNPIRAVSQIRYGAQIADMLYRIGNVSETYRKRIGNVSGRVIMGCATIVNELYTPLLHGITYLKATTKVVDASPS